ncbi:GntR family transcriptional regulator [Frigidibacter sp. ROC022]|uniref:GntR family transcriptional regulator n=1 Tax=Frigidibacter sp. ROC022 TaxID=2971796 RepID=UPI00215B09C7|nr:GntR family transcriptional regulator [Frigidibacter sp. ROC022]MCR8723759.1 GntR family transcriptional regulator [Frigidibacter sp. ROC022]
MAAIGALKTREPARRPTVADGVFDLLHRRILTLDLPPGTRLSEAEVAQAMSVSRQPVRDAFYRLSKLGFLTIRPQVATEIAPISAAAVLQARFIRAAIEAETAKAAATALSEEDHQALRALLERQRSAVETRDKSAFHALDDQFHKEICIRSGHAFAWETIREHKAHMDRVRYLSLAFASEEAFEDHQALMSALEARDPEGAHALMHHHLGHMREQIVRIRAEHSRFFTEEDDD